MGFNRVDEHIAKVKLQLTNTNGWISHFVTVWKGRPLLVSYNNLHDCLINVNYADFLEEQDLNFIVDLIKKYFLILEVKNAL